MADNNSTPKKILLIDDDQALQQLYELELVSRGYTVFKAENGSDGIAKAKDNVPDLILLDIMMPQLDGVATLGQIKSEQSLQTIPVIMLTNFGQENLVQQAFSLGATDFLLKYKVTPAEMADKVAEVLAPKTPSA